MPEETTHTTPQQNDDDNLPLHTCACGEQHRHRPGSRSHREECTSEKKFGDSCCCGPAAGSGNQHRCGHGPRCQ
ncbi:hypothetical protein [Methanoregula sp.]|uniref:hypothetical protein n=1 Tax=Methanoregula sp. TaxID=2052170 RepID=UPI0026051F52|nr:hypothetical protein [Methanoregula sp.]MDD5143591.1 hypothetical protein [Methanoregula sp.]